MKFRKSNYGLVLVLVLFGCSSVEITKVPSKTQYSTWNDEQQRRVDSIEGVRYYMPRPYVNVYKPFLVNSTAYIVNGFVTADMKYIRLKELSPNAPEWLRGIIGIHFSDLRRAQVGSGGEQSSGSRREQGDGGREQAGSGEAEDGETTAMPTPVPAETGKSKLKVTNDNNAFAITPMRDYYDIVYLPDFDEQYAVSRKSGLFGKTTSSVNLGQGWSLQGLDIEVDNSVIGGVILDLLRKGAKKIFGLPGGEQAGDGGGEQGKDMGADVEERHDREITLRITKAEYVAPGLYPIPKPREIMELVQSNKGNSILAAFKTFTQVDIQPFMPFIPFQRNERGEEVSELSNDECQPDEVIKVALKEFINKFNDKGIKMPDFSKECNEERAKWQASNREDDININECVVTLKAIHETSAIADKSVVESCFNSRVFEVEGDKRLKGVIRYILEIKK